MLARVSLLVAVPVALVIACRNNAAPRADPLSLQVLVELRLAGTAPAEDRTRSIHEAADRLLRALRGAGIAHEVTRRFETIPWIGLRIAPTSRERVAALPEVAGVSDDRIEQPLRWGDS